MNRGIASERGKLDRTNGLPLYRQIEQELRERIHRGQILPGETLPSIRELTKEFEVNHLTVRQAIRILGEEGIVVSSQGRGTYVRRDIRTAAKLALVLPNLANSLPDAIARGVRSVMDEHGIGGVAVFSSHDSAAEEATNVVQALGQTAPRPDRLFTHATRSHHRGTQGLPCGLSRCVGRPILRRAPRVVRHVR